MKIRNVLFYALMLMSSFVYADGNITAESLITAAQKEGDISRQILKLIFGDIITNPLSGSGDETLVSSVVFTFNAVVIVLAGVYLGWIMLKKTTRGAQLGQVVEGATDTGNKVLKTTGGFIMLIPIPTAGGWNLAQLFFLWAASLMGVGGANLVSNSIADGIINGQTVYTQPVLPEMSAIARQMYETNLCALGINQGLEQLKASGTAYEESAVMKEQPGVKIPGMTSVVYGNGSAVCGGWSFRDKSDAQLQGGYTGSNSYNGGNSYTASSPKTKAINKTILTASQNMFHEMNVAANAFNQAYWNRLIGQQVDLPDSTTAINKAALKFQQTVSGAVNTTDETENNKKFFTQEVKNKGWLSIGTMYRLMTTTNTNLQNTVAQKPVNIPANLQGDVAALDYYQGLLQAYQTQKKNSPYVPALGTVKGAVETDESSEDVDVYSLGGFFARMGLGKIMASVFSAKYGSGDGQTALTNPILKVKEVGDYTILTAEVGLGAFVITKAAITSADESVFGSITNFFTGLGKGAVSAIETLHPWVFTILMTLFIIGGIMSVYIPLIPTINWIVAITDWIIAIIAGAVGSTLWAATHLNVGESNGDRSTTGYIFIIDVMIRPLLMVLGFLFASLTLIALGTLLDLIFYPAFMIAQGTSTTGLMTIIFLLVIYARIMSGLVLRIFTLPIRLPNWVISWIGNRGYDSILGDMTSHVSGIFAGLGRGVNPTGKPKDTPASNNTPPTNNGINSR